MDVLDIFRFATELGFYWGPPFVVLVLFVGLVLSRWKRRYRKPLSLFVNWEMGGLAAVSIIGLMLFYQYWGMPDPFKPGEIGFLVAQVPGDTSGHEQNTYAEEIIRAINATPELAALVKVRRLERPLARTTDGHHAGALRLAKRLNASLVLRFVRVEQGHVPWLTIVDPPEPWRESVQLQKVLLAQLAQLEQTRLPEDMALIARCAAAFSFHQSRRYEEASREFERILSSPRLPVAAPSRPTLLFYLAVAHGRLRNLDAAIAALQTALELKPDFPEAYHYNLGTFFLAKGQLDQAISALRKALELKPDFPEALTNLGVALGQKHKPNEAIAVLSKALRLEPDSPEALNNLGTVHLENGQVDQAITAYREALQIRGNYPMALSNLGNALWQKKQFDEAIVVLRRAVELNPDFPDALSNLGLALAGKHELDEAIVVLRRAVELKPDDHEILTNLGSAYFDRHELDQAIAAFRKALDVKPDYHIAHYNLGLALYRKGQLDEAIAAYRIAVKLKPDYYEAFNNLGVALRKKGQFDEAITAFRKAIELNPNLWQAHYGLGRVFRLEGQEEEAQKAFAEAKRLNPQFRIPLQEE